MDRVGIGIVGLGNISGAYLKAAKEFFPILDIRAVADLNPDAAKAKADEFGLKAVSLDEIFKAPDVEIILNLTIPRAHVDVGLRAIDAGKHVYSEKPLGVEFAQGRKLVAAAKAKGLRVGSAPDTFLGGAHQTSRRLVDAGLIGTPVGGTAYFMCPGHERWHPNPAFYYDIGGGPMLDMGPYYITDLVNLLGPVARVAGIVTTPQPTRTVTAKERFGEIIPVHVPTHVSGTLLFRNGAAVQMTMSFDVAGHKHVPIEIYGTEATLIVPDPNRFGGQIETMKKGGEWTNVETDLPYHDGNFRSIGLADMALAIRHNRPHRANGDLALHVLEVMEAFGRASAEGRSIEIETTAERPAPIASSLVDGKLTN
jgi:predicted dehydrogenase